MLQEEKLQRTRDVPGEIKIYSDPLLGHACARMATEVLRRSSGGAENCTVPFSAMRILIL